MSELILSELARRTGINQRTLVEAIRKGRLHSVRQGKFYLSTIEDVEDAIRIGHLRRPKKKLE